MFSCEHAPAISSFAIFDALAPMFEPPPIVRLPATSRSEPVKCAPPVMHTGPCVYRGTATVLPPCSVKHVFLLSV